MNLLPRPYVEICFGRSVRILVEAIAHGAAEEEAAEGLAEPAKPSDSGAIGREEERANDCLRSAFLARFAMAG